VLLVGEAAHASFGDEAGRAIQKWSMSQRKGFGMSFADKVEHKAEELKGAAKEKIGDATDNERLQAEGAVERDAAKIKQAGDHVRDAARDTKDAFTTE
jgi:uncharacterized protein YjbJ (UPF0337 family)